MTNEELCIQIRNGDDSVLTTLWEQTDKLFYSIARSVYARHRERAMSFGVEAADCLQVCWFAFLDAVDAYVREQEREVQFASFAGYHVRMHIYALLGLRTSKRNPLNYASSIDAPINSDECDYTLGDVVADESATVPFDEIANADIAREVMERVNDLPPNRRDAVLGHFWEGRTFTDIANASGVSQQSVSNLYRDALRRLRRDTRLRRIHDEFYADADLTKKTGLQFFKENGMSSVEWHLLKLEEMIARVKGGDGP